MILWLHERGYNFFNINKLTYQEINCLISAFNRKARKEQREMKKLKK